MMIDNRDYERKVSLAHMYEEVREELGFGVSLASLMEDTDVWETDIAGGLKKAYRHLVRANSRVMNPAEKTGQLLLAELYIRDLVEHLNSELTDRFLQISGPDFAQLGRQGSEGQQQEEFASTIITQGVDRPSEESPYRMTRKGTDIDVIVDHETDTNFFADMSYDLHHGGLFVATYNILEVGRTVNVRLVLPGKYTFVLRGKVAWAREPENCAEDVSPGMGIIFETLSQESTYAIRQFMTERQPLLFEVA